MGPTPTRTPTPILGMCLSCNFVNVYTMAYRVQYTFTRVHARIPNGHLREDPRAEVGEDVRVGPMEFKLNNSPQTGSDMPYGHVIVATVTTLGVCQGHSSIASFLLYRQSRRCHSRASFFSRYTVCNNIRYTQSSCYK